MSFHYPGISFLSRRAQTPFEAPEYTVVIGLLALLVTVETLAAGDRRDTFFDHSYKLQTEVCLNPAHVATQAAHPGQDPVEATRVFNLRELWGLQGLPLKHVGWHGSRHLHICAPLSEHGY